MDSCRSQQQRRDDTADSNVVQEDVLSPFKSGSVVSNEDVVRVRMLLELLFIRSRVYQLDNFSASDVKVLIDSLCTC